MTKLHTWHKEKGIRPSALAKKPLGRKVPSDLSHIAKYPLSAATPEAVAVARPVVIGVNWYSDFDNPVRKGSEWWIGLDPHNLGSIRGGHCVCLKDGRDTDPGTWYTFYNQGREGACVGFGTSRAASLIFRRRFNPWWMWDHAKLVDEWGDTNPGDDNGTSVHAAFDVWRTVGHVEWKPSMDGLSVADRDALAGQSVRKLKENRWATTVSEVLDVLKYPLATKHGALPLLNSWGDSYPHIVWVPGETAQRLIDEDGEFGIPIL